MALEQVLMGLKVVNQLTMYMLILLVLFAYKEIMNKLKRRFYKRKAVEVELIGPDRKSEIIVCQKKDDSHYEVDSLPFFINPLKSISRDGVQVFTHVLGNSFAHDFINDPKEVLKKIIQDCKTEKKLKDKEGKEEQIKDITNHFHNIFDEPYRVDARMLQEVLINAQLSSKTLWDELIKIFKNKNILGIATIVAIGVGLTLLVAFQTYDAIVHMDICQVSSNINV